MENIDLIFSFDLLNNELHFHSNVSEAFESDSVYFLQYFTKDEDFQLLIYKIIKTFLKTYKQKIIYNLD